ncbi:hypothetical protein D3C73_1624750 [compost metagenome]
MRSTERHLRKVVRNSLNLPLRPTWNCIDRKIEFDQSISWSRMLVETRSAGIVYQ